MPTAETLFNSSFSWSDILTGSGLLTLTGILIYAIIKWKFFELISVETATVALRTSWGKPKYHNRRLSKLISWGVIHNELFGRFMAWLMQSQAIDSFVAKTGRLVVLQPGPHQVFRGWQGLIVVNLREIPLELDKREMTFRNRTLWFQPTVIVQSAYSDDHAGDRNLIKNVYSVRDTDVRDQTMDNMRTKLRALHTHAFAQASASVKPDKQGFPKFNLEQVKLAIEDELLELHGYQTKRVLKPVMAWTEAQIRHDGQVTAARIEAKAKIQVANILAGAINQTAQPTTDDPSDHTSNQANDRTPIGLAVAAATQLDDTA